MTVVPVEAATGELAPPMGWLGRARRALVLLVAAGGDAVNFYGALAIADPNLYGWQVVAAVLALTSATVGLMHFAGVSARKRRLGGVALWSRSVGTLTVLWLSMGASAFLIRVTGEPDGPALALPGAPAAATGFSFEQVPLGLLMFTLFLGTGGMAAWAAYNGHDPEHDHRAALRMARRWIRSRALRATRRAVRRQRRQERRSNRRSAVASGLRRASTACMTGAHRSAAGGAGAVGRAVQRRRERAQIRQAEGMQKRARLEAEEAAAKARQEAERSAALARQESERVLHALESREQAAHEALTTAVAAHEQVVDLVQRRKADAARDIDRHRAAQETVDPWADELRDYARLRLAAALSDPSTTTALTAPQLPRPVQHRQDAS